MFIPKLSFVILNLFEDITFQMSKVRKMLKQV